MKRNWIKIVSIVAIALALPAIVMLVVRPRFGGHRRSHSGLARPELENEPVGSDHSTVVSTEQNESVDPKATTELQPWGRFRGPNGDGTSKAKGIPIKWSDSENIFWKTELPGAGSSSPVLTSERVFVTSYSGYGMDSGDPGAMPQLKRHLSCVDRKDGKILWTRDVDAKQPEDPYRGMGIPEHGYATNTPVTDGKAVYAFMGKSGVHAFDVGGKPLWSTSVGTESGNRGWGTAASLILYDNLVIVNASEESQSIVALDKSTGKKVWEAPASILELAYGTPAIVKVNEERDDLVIAVPSEVWGLNPRTGKLVWYVQTSLTDNLSPSVVVDGTTIYVFGGYRSSGSVAIKVGGTGDVSKSHVLWTSRSSSYVATPVLLDGRLYWIDDRGMYHCIDASNGNQLQKARTPGLASGERPVYASPVVIDGKIYVQTRTSGLYVLNPGDKLDVLAQNKFDSDRSVFNATPAVDEGQLFLRSYRYLYCLSDNSAASGK